MSINSFKIQKVKAISLAECSKVPKVMVIAGPNGVRRSTLIYQISRQNEVVNDTGTLFFYQPPHRAIRKTSVRRSWLGGGLRSILSLLSQDSISGYEGLNFQNPSRSPDNIDETGSTIKHTLGKIENNRQMIVTELFDRYRKSSQQIDLKTIPDIYFHI